MLLILSTLSVTMLTLVTPAGSEKPQPAVPVVKVGLGKLALEQLNSTTPTAVCTTPAPVTSLESGLPYAQRVSRSPIVAMSESKGWFVYATSVVRGDNNGRAVAFISGYAIKRGGRQLIHWSVW